MGNKRRILDNFPGKALARGGVKSVLLHKLVSILNSVSTRIQEQCARTLQLPFLVMRGVFFLFLSQLRAEFAVIFLPLSRGAITTTWHIVLVFEYLRGWVGKSIHQRFASCGRAAL